MKKKNILTLVTIASISALAVTGCKKADDATNNKQENMIIESTNGSTDQDIDESDSNTDTTENEQSESSDAEARVDNNKVAEEDSKTETSQETSANEDDKDPSNTTAKAEVELPIYTINDESLETEDAIAYVSADTEITAEVIVDEVVEAFSANSYEVKIGSVSQEGDTVIVNFMKGSAPVTGVGAGEEEATLDCISYSLLDNLSTCKKVIFRIDGEAYMSGHIQYEINEPHMTGNEN
ncbi:hypothetical protein [Anaerosporobacter sp.]